MFWAIRMLFFLQPKKAKKMALSGWNDHSFYIDPLLSCLKSKEYPVYSDAEEKKLCIDLLPKSLKKGNFHFSLENDPKITLNG